MSRRESYGSRDNGYFVGHTARTFDEMTIHSNGEKVMFECFVCDKRFALFDYFEKALCRDCGNLIKRI